jgi:hypothetical protein
MRKWRQWRALSGGDRRLLVRAAALLVYARWRLRFVDFRVDRDAAERARAATSPDGGLARAQAIARLVGIAAAHVPVRVTCLHRSLVLWELLRRERIACELRLGARAGSAPFDAHAWVQCAGLALEEAPAHLARFAPFGDPVTPVGIRPGRRLPARRTT